MAGRMTRIAHISDVHFGRVDPPIAEALIADMAAIPPTLLVVSGDLTQRARVGQYKAAAEFLERLPSPLLVIPGNHDIPLWNLARRFFAPTERFEQYISADLNPVWRQEGLIVVGVNTARSFTRTSGWIGDEQMKAIKAAFASAGDTDHRILVTHHPFIPSPAHPKADVLRRASETLAQLESCNVDILLAGHLHRAYHDDVRVFYRDARRSILSIQAGTASSTRLRGEPNSYNLITLDGDVVQIDVRTWAGQRFEQTVQKRYSKIEGVWQSQKQNAEEIHHGDTETRRRAGRDAGL
jgi:3',5'-cyclic AMP phosphodiesterase CpdA